MKRPSRLLTIRTVLVLLGLAPALVGQSAPPLFENSAFQAGTFRSWTAQGTAFEAGPTDKQVTPDADTTGSIEKGLANNWNASRNLYLQPELTGCDGKTFANSFHPETLNRATGTLTSVPFVVRHAYLRFQLAGGRVACAGKLAVNLLADGEIVRQALPRGEKFVRCSLDLRDLKGREARLEIVDAQRLHGGWIAAGSFAGADTPADGPVIDGTAPVHHKVTAQRTFRCDRRYLNIPARRGFPDDAVKLIVDGRIAQELCMSVCDEKEAEFWQFLDLGPWQGKQVTLTMTGWSASAEPLAGAMLDDRIRGLENLYDEPNRPQFHFTPPQGWSNDVNGTVYYDGEYHLFYQYDPSRSGIIGRNMHWGHAVSTDFFHWQHLPIALGVDPERGQNYSGSAIVDHHNVAGFQQGEKKTLIAFYTRRMPHMYHEFDFDVDSSDQCLAYSTDCGRTWTHVEKPVVPGITGKNRDPKVFFHEETNKWIMVFFIRGGYDFYASDNLRDWTRLSHAKGFHECPDVFQLALDGEAGNKPWLVVNGNGEYAIGDFDGREFTEQFRGRTIFGRFHATQTFANAPDDPLRRVQMSWLRYDLRDLPCRQMLSLPVEITLRSTADGPRLFAEPARELDGLRTEQRSIPDVDLSSGPLEIRDLPWQLTDTELTIDLNDTRKVELNIRGQPLTYETASGTLELTGSPAKATVPAVDGKLKLRILIDRCSIDVCAQDGRAFLMHVSQPDWSKPVLAATAEGGRAMLRDLTIHRLKSVWPKERDQK